MMMRRRPPLLLWLGMFFFLRHLLGHRRHGWSRSGQSPYGYGRGGGRNYF